ncbi:MAG: hypothetical protein AAGI25_04260 [Bacteroidota bacterium]
MEINKKNRTELKQHFQKNKKPTEQQFAEFIDANINQAEDGIAKVQGNPLALQAEGESVGTQEVLNVFSTFADDDPQWSLNLNPRVNPQEPDSNEPGLNIKDATGESRLFIKSGKGSIGLGTIEPTSKLTINANNDQSSLSVVDNTEQYTKVFEVSQKEGDGILSIRNGKANKSLDITSSSILFEDRQDTSNIKSAKIVATEDALKIFGKTSGTNPSTKKVEILSEGGITIKGTLNIEGEISSENVASDAELGNGASSDKKIPTQKAVKTYVDTRLPKGLISMWSGKEMPTGWALCDGTNSTPDLSGKFIVGFAQNSEDYGEIGNTGGLDQVKLDKEHLPPHHHSGTTDVDGKHSHNISFKASKNSNGDSLNTITMDGENHGTRSLTTDDTGEHSHSFQTDDTGGDQPHENRPPYYVLAYIMKL